MKTKDMKEELVDMSEHIKKPERMVTVRRVTFGTVSQDNPLFYYKGLVYRKVTDYTAVDVALLADHCDEAPRGEQILPERRSAAPFEFPFKRTTIVIVIWYK